MVYHAFVSCSRHDAVFIYQMLKRELEVICGYTCTCFCHSCFFCCCTSPGLPALGRQSL